MAIINNSINNTLQTPFKIAAVSVTTTGTQLNYLNAASGTTGTGSVVFATAPTLSALTVTGNSTGNNFISAAFSTVSSGTLLTLTSASPRAQRITGSTTQTIQLPAANTLSLSWTFEINNNSTGAVTVNDGAAGFLFTVPSGGYAVVFCIAPFTVAGAWDWHFEIPANGAWGTAGLNGVTLIAPALGTPVSGNLSNCTNVPLTGAVLLAPAGAQTITTYGLTVPSLNTANLAFDVTANTIASTNTNGNINLIPNGTGSFLLAGTVANDANSILQATAISKTAAIHFGTFSNTNLGSTLYLSAASGTTPGTFAAVSSGRILGQVVFNGADGTQLYPGAQIVASANGTISTSTVPTQLEFKTSNTSGVMTTGITLTNAQIVNLANALPVTSGGTGQTLALTANNLIYASSTTAMASLATANNGVLITSSGGAPSISSTLPSAVQTNITELGIINQNLTLSPAAPAANRAIILNTDNTYTGTLLIQAGGGSASFGGGLIMYGASHATKPGWATIGLSSGGTRYFTINNQGIGGGLDVFTVDSAGQVVVGNPSAAAGKITINPATAASGTLQLVAANCAGNYANVLTNVSTTGARIWSLPDATGTIQLVGGALGAATATSLTFSPTTGGIIGTTTNDNVAAGTVGELDSAVVLVGSAVALTTATPADAVSLVLQPGDYDVWAELWFDANIATIVSSVQASINTTTATIATVPSENTSSTSLPVTLAAGVAPIMTLGQCRISVATATTTTAYLVVNATFTVNSLAAYGKILARRRR